MRTLPRQEDQPVVADDHRCQLDPATWLHLPGVAACIQPARVAIEWPAGQDHPTIGRAMELAPAERVTACPGHALAALEAGPQTTVVILPVVPEPDMPADALCGECRGTGLILDDDGSLTGTVDCPTLCCCIESFDTVRAYVSAVVAYALTNSYPGHWAGGVGRADVAPGLGRHVGLMLDLVHQWVHSYYRGTVPPPTSPVVRGMTPSVRPQHVIDGISGPSVWSFE